MTISNLSNYNHKQLEEYLKTHPELSKGQVTEIKGYMDKLLKDGYKMLDKWINSRMFELSAWQLKREGKAKITLCGNQIHFSVDPLEALIKANEIIVSANKKGIDL